MIDYDAVRRASTAFSNNIKHTTNYYWCFTVPLVWILEEELHSWFPLLLMGPSLELNSSLAFAGMADLIWLRNCPSLLSGQVLMLPCGAHLWEGEFYPSKDHATPWCTSIDWKKAASKWAISRVECWYFLVDNGENLYRVLFISFKLTTLERMNKSQGKSLVFLWKNIFENK